MKAEIQKSKKIKKSDKALDAKTKITKKEAGKKEDVTTQVDTLKMVEVKKTTAEKKTSEKKKSYLYAVGRRKEAKAQVKLYKNGKGNIKVNGKLYSEYFSIEELQQIVSSPMKSVGQADKVDIEAKVCGGGLRGQAEAIRLGIARALVQLNINFKKNLRKGGFLTRDPRAKERKKPGLKRARRAPQWQKR